MVRYRHNILWVLLLLAGTTVTAQGLDPAQFHHIRSGVKKSFEVFERTGKGRVAFMGGSITESPGWRDKVSASLQHMFPATTFEFINAGISSTGSTPGAFRLSRDVLSMGKIDLLFEEAAVNDPTNGFYGKYQLRGMEGVVRQALLANPQMDIVLLYFADPEKLQSYNSGQEPEVITRHEAVAKHYAVNSINLAREVTERIHAGEFSWERDFIDLHPSPFGQELYARSILRFLENARQQLPVPAVAGLPDPLDSFSYYHGRYMPITHAKLSSGFRIVADWVPDDSLETRKQYVHVPALVGTQAGDQFSFSFRGKALGICITAGPDAGIIEYHIDGQYQGKVDLYTKWSHLLHLPWYVILHDELPDTEHVATIRIAASKNPSSRGNAVRIQHFLVNGN